MVDVVEALQRTVLFHVKQPARIPLKQLAAIRAPVTEPHVELTPKPRAPTSRTPPPGRHRITAIGVRRRSMLWKANRWPQ